MLTKDVFSLSHFECLALETGINDRSVECFEFSLVCHIFNERLLLLFISFFEMFLQVLP